MPDGQRRLVRAALQLFAQKGFDGVTVRDIAAASGVSPGLIRHHFGSKEGLREAADQLFIAQFEEALHARLPENGEGPERVALWVDEWVARHQADWPTTVAYFRRAVLEESEWGQALFARFHEFAQARVTRMDAAGAIRPDVDRLWLPFLYLYLELGTMLLDPMVTRLLGRSGFEPDLWRRRYRAYIDLIARGVRPGPTSSTPADDYSPV